ncbi:hypothetical protein CEXT_729491 [Caerostris extrusa]|uniref:Uncharacterized protein n=1 Tax=Caerostris extrusa TaxID=172846 RepID=A0AAV4WP54_CAEEX|nr:hypothetical protein CEXT_729491 [Caerostris extrusa]
MRYIKAIYFTAVPQETRNDSCSQIVHVLPVIGLKILVLDFATCEDDISQLEGEIQVEKRRKSQNFSNKTKSSRAVVLKDFQPIHNSLMCFEMGNKIFKKCLVLNQGEYGNFGS